MLLGAVHHRDVSGLELKMAKNKVVRGSVEYVQAATSPQVSYETSKNDAGLGGHERSGGLVETKPNYLDAVGMCSSKG